MRSDHEGPVRYRFGPLEHRGIVVGLRGGQIATVATALVIGVLLIRTQPTPVAMVGAVAILALSLAVSVWPIRGRTAEEWAPDVSRFALESIGRRRTQRATFIETAHLGQRSTESARLPSRHPLARLSILRVPLGDESSGIGVLRDDVARTLTAVLAVRSRGFALLGEDDRARKVAGWSGVLASMAREGSAVHRVQWIVQCLSDAGTHHRRQLALRAVLGRSTAPERSYAEVLDVVGPVAPRYQVMVALSVRFGRGQIRRPLGREVRPGRVGTGGVHEGFAVLLREVVALQRRMGDADIEVEGALSPVALARSIRRTFLVEGPRSGWSEVGGPPVAGDENAPVSPGWPWPTATVGSWDRLRADGTWHVTYWIAEWPRIEVGADFLGPLLILSDVRRTVSVTMEPLNRYERQGRSSRLVRRM
jgi:hypothetical protein